MYTGSDDEGLPPEGTIVTAWGYPRLPERAGTRHRGTPHTGTLGITRNPHTGADDYWLSVQYPREAVVTVDPATITPPLPADTSGATVGLVPIRWPRPSDEDVRIAMEIYGPHGHAGWVTVMLPAIPAVLLAGAETRALSGVCTHLVAGHVRSAYEAGQLVLPEPFEPRRYTVELAFGDVDALLRSSVALPVVGEFEDKTDLGWSASDIWGEWPLTLYDLVDDGAGDAMLTLGIDAESGPILTFNFPVPATILSTHWSRPVTSTADPFWRAAVRVAVEAIRAMDDRGEIATPDELIATSVTIDVAEAVRISRDPVALDRLIELNPTRWPSRR